MEPLEKWRGKSEDWVIAKLGLSPSQHQLDQPVPDFGSLQTLQVKLKKEYPDYVGEIRLMTWKKEGRNYQVALINPQEGWLVLDALQWKEGVVF